MPLTLSGNGTISDLASAPTVGGTALPTNLSDLGIANHDQITVDSSGRISNSNPTFSANRDGLSSGAISGNVPLNVVLDTASGWNNSTNVYTVPKSGRYFVSLYNLTAGDTGIEVAMRINVNGVAEYFGYSSSGTGTASTQYLSASVSGVINAQESDTIAWYQSNAYTVYGGKYAGMSIIYLG